MIDVWVAQRQTAVARAPRRVYASYVGECRKDVRRNGSKSGSDSPRNSNHVAGPLAREP